MPVKVSHTIDLGPELPNDVLDIAREQGEDPDRVCALIQELRDMIYGKWYWNGTDSWIFLLIVIIIKKKWWF